MFANRNNYNNYIRIQRKEGGIKKKSKNLLNNKTYLL